MRTRFSVLFKIGISHEYYASGRCEDFEFCIPEETAEAMRRGRLLARTLDGVLHVLYEADGQGDPIGGIAGQTLLFGLTLKNPYFGNFTSPDAPALNIADGGLAPLFDQAQAVPGEPAGFDLEAEGGVRLVSGTYAHQPQVGICQGEEGCQVKVTLSDANGNPVATETAPPAALPAFDLRALPAGFWRVTEQKIADGQAAGPARDAGTLLLSPGLRGGGAWGVMAITVDAAFYAAPASFNIGFAARQETLAYYIVGTNYSDAQINRLHVVDEGENGRDSIPFTDPVYKDGIDPSLLKLLLPTSEATVALFESAVEVKRRERSRRNILLRLRNTNDVVLAQHLPQPGASQASARFIIHLSNHS